jgi:hypothetical protein
MEGTDKGVTATLHALAVGAQIVRLPGHPVDVGAGAEPPAGSGHDDGAHLVVEPQLREVVTQALTHIDGQRVELVGAVQHHLRNGAINRQIDRHSRAASTGVGDRLGLGPFGRPRRRLTLFSRSASRGLDLGQPPGADFGLYSRQQCGSIGSLRRGAAVLEALCIGPEIGEGVVRHLRQLGEQVHTVSPGEWSPAPENTTPVDACETQFAAPGKTERALTYIGSAQGTNQQDGRR